MSEENLTKLRAFLATWTERPWRLEEAHRLLEADMSLFDPDVTYEDTTLPDHVGEIYRGHDGVIRATERWVEPFEGLKIDGERIVGQGDSLVSIHRFRAKARHTGIELEGPVAYLWTLQNGKVIHFQSFQDPEQALKAAGLEE
jgi:ketosteroid isomerase-like protein